MEKGYAGEAALTSSAGVPVCGEDNKGAEEKGGLQRQHDRPLQVPAAWLPMLRREGCGRDHRHPARSSYSPVTP